jgi:hypothetical protein
VENKNILWWSIEGPTVLILRNIFMRKTVGRYQLELQGRWVLVIHVQVGHSRGGGYCPLGGPPWIGFESVPDLDVQET